MFLDIGVVVPAFNEESKITSVLDRIKKHIIPENIVVVDDGSSDLTAEMAKDAGVHVISHPVNSGKGKSLRSGFDRLTDKPGIKAVITIDSDGQHDPEEIPGFVNKFYSGEYDLILGDRMTDTSHMPFLRKITNRVTSKVISGLTGCKLKDSQSGYRLIKSDLLRSLDLKSDRFDAESEILIKAARNNYSIGSVKIKTIYSEETSKIDPCKDTLRFLKLVFKSFFW
ncbi:MAG: glycosyltransferase family 2 protein [Candidatus Krumholzibacteriota bacterium]|nr:glycosyltransferase family 2 protein [Candidatus Krumholzibacteriota bacterium]